MQCCSKEFMRDLYQYCCYWFYYYNCVCVRVLYVGGFFSMQGNHLRGNNCGDGAILGF